VSGPNYAVFEKDRGQLSSLLKLFQISDTLLRFVTRATQRQLRSKIDAKFGTLTPVKLGRDGKNV